MLKKIKSLRKKAEVVAGFAAGFVGVTMISAFYTAYQIKKLWIKLSE